MDIKILHDEDCLVAVLYCPVGMYAFGPVFQKHDAFVDSWGAAMGAQEIAEAFLKWLPGDARELSLEALEADYADFIEDGTV